MQVFMHCLCINTLVSKVTATNLCTTCMDIVLSIITLMYNYGHVLHAAHVHEPLWWVERVPTRQKSILPHQSLLSRLIS